MADKFVRFVTHETDEVTGMAVGFFQAAYDLLDDGGATPSDYAEIKVLVGWFKDHLDKPDRFARSKNRHAHGKALSWFKPSAAEHIAKARELLLLLERSGVQTEMLTTARPGAVIYEDKWQIAAIPYSDREF